MTAREELLRKAIMFEMSIIGLKRAKARRGSLQKTTLDEVHRRLFEAIKQADETNDEEVMPTKLKQYMGIE